MKTQVRSTDVNDQRNWALDCGFPGCGERFDPALTVGDTAVHWNHHVGGKLGDGRPAERDKPVLNLVWIGVGQVPRGKPSWLQ